VIEAAISGDYAPFFRLHEVLATPFDLADKDAEFARPPTADEVVPATYCGT
jgi:uncharacterized protein YdiU (UPF0061 family)